MSTKSPPPDTPEFAALLERLHVPMVDAEPPADWRGRKIASTTVDGSLDRRIRKAAHECGTTPAVVIRVAIAAAFPVPVLRDLPEETDDAFG